MDDITAEVDERLCKDGWAPVAIAVELNVDYMVYEQVEYPPIYYCV